MNIRPISSFESPGWIAEGATYVVEGADGELDPMSIGYSQIKQRLSRADLETLVTRVSDGDKVRDVISKGASDLGIPVYLMDRYVETVVRTRKPAFDFDLREDGKLIRVVEHEPGRYYNRLALLIWKTLNSEFGLNRFALSPRAEVFRDAMTYLEPQAGHMIDCFKRFPTSWDRLSSRYCGEFANELGVVIVQIAEARGLGKLVTKWKADGDRARTRMQDFVRTRTEGRESVLVLQLDTDYRNEVAGRISTEQAKRNHAKFVNRLRGNARLGAVAFGGIWTLEWAALKGHHFRWLFMLDASLTSDAAEWGGLIADIWQSVVPNNVGHVHIPGANDRERPASGLIRVDDPIGMKTLMDEIDYVVEKDQYLRPKSIAGQRSWGTWVPAYTRDDRRINVRRQPTDVLGAEEPDSTP